MLLTTCPSVGGQEEQRGQEQVRATAAHRVDEHGGHPVGGPARLDGGRERDEGPDQHHGLPRDGPVGLGHGHHPQQHEGDGSGETGDGGGHLPRAEHRHERRQHQHGARRPGAPRDRLAAHHVRRVDQQDVAVAVELVQRGPPSVQQDRVALRELDGTVAQVLAEPLRGQHDQGVLPLHPPVDALAHQPGAGRHDDLGDARLPGHQVLAVADPHHAHGEAVLDREPGDVVRRTGDDEGVVVTDGPRATRPSGDSAPTTRTEAPSPRTSAGPWPMRSDRERTRRR